MVRKFDSLRKPRKKISKEQFKQQMGEPSLEARIAVMTEGNCKKPYKLSIVIGRDTDTLMKPKGLKVVRETKEEDTKDKFVVLTKNKEEM